MPYFIAQSREQISIWWRKHCIKEIKRRYLSGQQNLIQRVCKCLRKTIIRKFTGKSQHITHSVQHGNINLFLLAPCNASCPRNGQTHVKNLAAFAARFLTCVWPFSKYLSLTRRYRHKIVFHCSITWEGVSMISILYKTDIEKN